MRDRDILLFLSMSLGAVAVEACASSGPRPSAPPGVVAASMTVTSRSFVAKGAIPIDYTCGGKNVSPQLAWSAPPPGTRSLTLEVEDPDASHANFTHWLVYDIPPDVTQLAEAVDVAAVHATVGLNDFPDTKYGGPCPPHGEAHRYVFRVFALDTASGLHEGASRAAVDAAMSNHVLGEGQLIANFAN
jgi:Raf kinase inhibitor-like YbhB/YbcL family protein